MCAAALTVAGSGFVGESPAAEPPASKSPAAQSPSADRGAEVLNRLRRRDPAAALKRYSGRWRKAGEATPAIPELTPHAPARLRSGTPAIPVLRRQADEGDGETSDGLDLEIDLEGLGLDDLELPDDLKLDLDGGTDDEDEDAVDPEERPTPKADRAVRQVRDLKSIRNILPFGDYDPNPDPEDDPYRNLCPRPAGAPRDGEDDDETAALCPEVRPLSTERYSPRPVRPVQYRWAASNVAYNPLYFQDVSLERYGHNYGLLQPVVSVGKFGTQLIGLPYQMALDPPCKCVYPLGYYRPGDCAPKLHYQIPLNARAALVQAAAVSGVALILP